MNQPRNKPNYSLKLTQERQGRDETSSKDGREIFFELSFILVVMQRNIIADTINNSPTANKNQL